MSRFPLMVTVVAFATALTSCIKEPVACIDIPLEVEVFSSAHLGNCSENAETYEWTIEDDEPNIYGFTGTNIKFSDEEVTRSWETPGTYTIRLSAYSKKDKKKDDVTETINVTDLCYECIREYYNSTSRTEVCASHWYYDDLDDFMEGIEELEDDGYECTKR